jgi:transcriptional regulator with XRE-family HTH domain
MTLADYLAKHGLSDATFAKDIGVDRSSVSRMRRCGQVPGPDILRLIADRTGNAVTPNDFFGVRPSDQQAAA